MWWTDWVKTLGSGFLGSLVGFLGAVVILLLTRKHERKMAEEKQAKERAAEVVGLTITLHPVWMKPVKRLDKCVNALLLLGAEQMSKHPNMAGWCFYQVFELTDSNEYGETERFFEAKGEIVSVLTRWSSSKLSEDLFTGKDWSLALRENMDRREEFERKQKGAS